MSWVKDDTEFKLAYQRALDCAAIDSGRGRTSFVRLTFNDVDVLSRPFADLIQKLLTWSSDQKCQFIVLRPDPIYYFHHFFGQYPVIDLPRGMSADEYLATLNEAPCESRADALGTIYAEYVFVPTSLGWFIHAIRSVEADGGHLWIPAEWVRRVEGVYPHAEIRGQMGRSPFP